MTATNPIEIEIDGQMKTFDRYSLNLIVSGSYSEGQPDASVVCNLVPTRIEGDMVETAPDNAINIRIGKLDQADAPTLAAVNAIHSALQTFITEKGL
jgi:hypothetical protein